MKRLIFLLALFLVGNSACYTGTQMRLSSNMMLPAEKCQECDRETRLRISDKAQVFRLTTLDAPQGFKLMDVKSEDWSFYMVRFNLQIMPLNREEVKSTYFAVKFSPASVIIDQLFPSSTARQVYLLASDLKAGGQARATAEAGYGWLRKKKEDKKRETREETQKGNLSEKKTVIEKENTVVTEEGLDKEGKQVKSTKSIRTEKSKVSESEIYDTEAVGKTFLRTLEKITDVNFNFTATGKAYLEASTEFSMSFKREKREPLITAIGRLSETAVWLDRQPFQNGDKYFSVIVKVPRTTKELANYFVREFRKSRLGDLKELLKMHKFQIDRHKVMLRFADDESLKGVFTEQEAKVIKIIRKEIDDLEKKLNKSRNEIEKELDDRSSRDDKSFSKKLGGYLHYYLKWLYKYESFAETFEETLKQKLAEKKDEAWGNAQKFAVSYVLKQIHRHRKDIQLFIAKNELDLHQITCMVEAQLNVNGTPLTYRLDKIRLSEPERVLSLVIE